MGAETNYKNIRVNDILLHKKRNGTFRVTEIDGPRMTVRNMNFKLGQDESEYLTYNLDTCYNDWIKTRD